MEPEQQKKLREPFPDNQIGKLPKSGGVWLDYVGHAAVTQRLLEVDPGWNWEPMALDASGLPALERTEKGFPIGMWIRLTICGVTRIGHGSVQPGAFDPEKQLIGDAIRNAAMRFGVALDLWAKEDLLSHDEGSQAAPAARQAPKPATPADDAVRDAKQQWNALTNAMQDHGLDVPHMRVVFGGKFNAAAFQGYLDRDPAHNLGTAIATALAHKGAASV